MKDTLFSNLTDDDLVKIYAKEMVGKTWDDSIRKPQIDGFGYTESTITKVIFRYPKEKNIKMPNGGHKDKLVFYIELSNGRIGEYICGLHDMLPFPDFTASSNISAHPWGKTFIPRINFFKPDGLKKPLSESHSKIQFTNDIHGLIMQGAFYAKVAEASLEYSHKEWIDYILEEELKLKQYNEFQKISTH